MKDTQRPLRSHNQQALPYRADESAGTEQRPEVGHTARRRHTDVAPIAPSAPHNLRGLNPEEKALLVRRFDNIRPGFIPGTQGTQGPKAGTADAAASAGMHTPLQAKEPRRLSLDASRTPAPAPVSTPDTALTRASTLALTRASTLALTGALPPARGRRGSILDRVTEVSSRWKVRRPQSRRRCGGAVLRLVPVPAQMCRACWQLGKAMSSRILLTREPSATPTAIPAVDDARKPWGHQASRPPASAAAGGPDSRVARGAREAVNGLSGAEMRQSGMFGSSETHLERALQWRVDRSRQLGSACERTAAAVKELQALPSPSRSALKRRMLRGFASCCFARVCTLRVARCTASVKALHQPTLAGWPDI